MKQLEVNKIIILDNYIARNHPDVRNGKKKEDE